MTQSIVWSPDCSTLIAAGHPVLFLDASTYDEIYSYAVESSVSGMDVSPDGTTLASGCVDKTVRIWDTATGRALMVLTDHTGQVTGVDHSSDGRLLASILTPRCRPPGHSTAPGCAASSSAESGDPADAPHRRCPRAFRPTLTVRPQRGRPQKAAKGRAAPDELPDGG